MRQSVRQSKSPNHRSNKQPLNAATVRKNNCGHANLGQVYDFVGNSVDMSAYGDEQWQSKSI